MTGVPDVMQRLALATPVHAGSLANLASTRAEDLLARLRSGQMAAPALRVNRRSWRPVVLGAAAVAALAVTGVGIAAALGAFDGISAANHPQTSADVISPRILAEIKAGCSPPGAPRSLYFPECHLVPESSRLIRRLPDGHGVYVIADTHKDFCILISEREMSCGGSLNGSMPITASLFGDAMYGVALDGVTGVSFEIAGRAISVPVKNNVWAYEGRLGVRLPRALIAHFANGTTVTVHE